MNSILNFYNRYVTGLSTEKALQLEYPLKGDSPFGEGIIIIKENGDFFCEVSNERGSQADFLKKLYPLLTKAGIERALVAEAKELEELNYLYVNSQVKAQTDMNKEFEHVCGMPYPESSNVWLDTQADILYGADTSLIEHPLCRYSWKIGDRNETILGTPRIETPKNANRLWFVENLLEVHLLANLLHEPVYLRPNFNALEWNDYQELTKGKEVVCLIGDDRSDWEFSFHPFLKRVHSSAANIKTVFTKPLTGGTSFTTWLNEENCTILKKVVDDFRVEITMLDKDTYHEFIGPSGSKKIYFPQDVDNKYFWYGTNEGRLVHSSPVNVLTLSEINSKYSLESTPYESSEIRLSSEELLNILSTHHQLSPFQVYTILRELINEYVYLENREISSLISLWIMGSYVYQLFPAYGYLHLHGEKDTGKTTLIELIEQCGFNGVLESQSTRANLIEKIHNLGCTVCLDEYEKDSMGSKSEYIHILNAGYKKGGSYSKKTGKNVDSRFNVYSPKALASINVIQDEALQSRTIPIKTTSKPSESKIEIWDKWLPHLQKKFQLIRRGGYTLGLYHHLTIQKLFRRLPLDIELPSGKMLGNRQRQLVAPLLSIAQLVDLNQQPKIERELLTAIELSWDSMFADEIKNLQLFKEQLVTWNSDPQFNAFKVSNGYVYIDNASWEETPLAKKLGGKAAVLKWFNSFSRIRKEATHITSAGTSRSSTAFPFNLKIEDSTFRERFSRDSPWLTM